MARDKNYEWFIKADLSKYVGNWIAIADQKVIAKGRTAKEAAKKAEQKFPKVKAILTKIPTKQVCIY